MMISDSHFVRVDVSRGEQDVRIGLFVHHLLDVLLDPGRIRTCLPSVNHLIEFEVMFFKPGQHIQHLLCLACTLEVGSRPLAEDDDVRRPKDGLFHAIKHFQLHPFSINQCKVDNSILWKKVVELVNFNLFITTGICIAIGFICIHPGCTSVTYVDYLSCFGVA